MHAKGSLGVQEWTDSALEEAITGIQESLSDSPDCSCVFQEVQKYLEAVYAVAPVPGEYVRYRLHLATALPLDLLDAWFDLRRKTSFYNHELNENASGVGLLLPHLLLKKLSF